MATRVIGLDVGTNAVRAVELELREPPKIVAMGQVGLPIGAVVDGEVVDVLAVSEAIRRLWESVAFSSRTVRVGISSVRVMVRPIEMPKLSQADLLSAVRLQLDEFVPFPTEETVFAVRPLDGADTNEQLQQLLFAATHRDAAQGLVEALQASDLKVAAVDVIPAALALALTQAEPEDSGSVDMLISVGASTLVVVAARAGEPLSSRILTNVSGRGITERIARYLSVGHEEAERYKRLVHTDDESSRAAILAAAPGVADVVQEVSDSITFYSGQRHSRPVRQVLLTGGGSLLPGLIPALEERLELPVRAASPFAGLQLGDTGFAVEDTPYLAPYMAAAVGLALGGRRAKGRRIDLTPVEETGSSVLLGRRVLAGVGVVAVLGVGGVVYVQGRSALAEEQLRIESAEMTLASLQSQLAAIASGGATPSGAAEASPSAVVDSVLPRMIDWLGTQQALTASGAPFGIGFSTFNGHADLPAGPVAAAAGSVQDPAATVPSSVGTVTVPVTAPSLEAVAGWLDVLTADPRYEDPIVGPLAMSTAADGTSVVELTMVLSLTPANLVSVAPAAAPEPVAVAG